ncbi:hypothetical protein [Tropicimonas sediminicola]|uniref:Response regulatory domain-containing protein n=1 Tax=Tropicimonas sediminicola TaxID=1031541 RepID=A0A239LZ56_9RHOB|nr:hypothetical protein [Tropicimonas sediminicola]SNT35570.1 hypothetical protein SAMN05421757_111179 [Tropicimonas sediminicola]
MQLILLERDMVIAEDIAEIVRSVFDLPHVMIVASVDAACAALEAADSAWDAVMLHGTSEEIGNERLRGLLTGKGLPAIVTGAGERIDLPPGWTRLPIPFTTDDLTTLLQRILPHRPTA